MFILNGFCRVLFLLVLCCLLAGCATFPPAHKNSFYTENEEVSVEMLGHASLCKENKLTEIGDYWNHAFQPIGVKISGCGVDGEGIQTTVDAPRMVGLPSALALVTPLVIDYTKKKLEDEADHYMSQFGTTVFDNSFWAVADKDKVRVFKQRYYGLKVVRKASKYNAELEDEKEVSFELVCGIAQDASGVFWLAPLSLQTSKAKAKVSAWFGKQDINTKIELSIDSVWIDAKGAFQKKNIALFDPIVVKKYNMEKPALLHNKEGAITIEGLNAFVGIPISQKIKTGNDNSVKYAGSFWLTVLVTESDTSKSKKYITDLAELLDENRDKIIENITGE